ncbi:MAG TPA: hypothetical protein VFA16_15795 [Mycobacterium sp.]|nr:hypothetical protein [Mycobacterium sp.]HZU48691.1 hypothetical protein [Mycobacterium sp.]
MRRRRRPAEDCRCSQCAIWRIRVKTWERRRRDCPDVAPQPYPEREHT